MHKKMIAASLLSALLAGCVGMEKKPDDSATAAKPGIPPGMNEKGEVLDSSKVDLGSGKKVVGLAETEGVIVGKPAPSSKFAKLQIGMTQNAVSDVCGHPSDQGTYMTGKGFIPFYMGGDRHRQEWVYKGQGRLVFTGGGLVGDTTVRLIAVIHNNNEPAYR